MARVTTFALNYCDSNYEVDKVDGAFSWYLFSYYFDYTFFFFFSGVNFLNKIFDK